MKVDLYDGKIVWGCAFSLTDDKSGMGLYKKPVLGVVHIAYTRESGYHAGHFHELKKNGGCKSTSVDIHSRVYADTYEQSIFNYNRQLQYEINTLQSIIESVENEKIKIEEVI